MMYLEFEKPIVELETKIAELRTLSDHKSMNLREELARLEKKVDTVTQDVFAKLTIWERTQLSRHPQRPYTLDYLEHSFDAFEELHGDRNFSDDPSMICGIATLDDLSVMVLGQQKGRSTKEKVYRNFGMPRPEGYRKALRIMRMAARFNMPIVTLIDTPGAYPGLGAEERGQAEAIAKNIMIMSELQVPIVSVVIGEGGSGGALAIGVADHLIMLEYAIYSVISPESCAAILWRSADKAKDAAKSLKLIAPEVQKLGIADHIIKEPQGAAHRDPKAVFQNVRRAIKQKLVELKTLPPEELLEKRRDKYRSIGEFAI